LPRAQTERRGDAGPVRLPLAAKRTGPRCLGFSVRLLATDAESGRAKTHAGRIFFGRGFCYNFFIYTMFAEVQPMAITVEAVYENGVLKPAQPLPFKEHEKVQIIVKPAMSRVRQSAGLMGWTGSQEDADFVAFSPELDPQESA
jgi:predicted DNA-binding antitoxin AbrB/MazE fold protein